MLISLLNIRFSSSNSLVRTASASRCALLSAIGCSKSTKAPGNAFLISAVSSLLVLHTVMPENDPGWVSFERPQKLGMLSAMSSAGAATKSSCKDFRTMPAKKKQLWVVKE